MIGYNKSEIVGKMRERVILQNRVISQSDSGFQSETYSNIATLWTALDYKTGFEEEDADKIVSQQKINFTLRYNQNITTDSRFVYRNSLYQIEKIDISNDRRFVFCTGVYRSSYTGSYALTIDLATSVNGFATLFANVNSLLYLSYQANASASIIATLTNGQQQIIEVASSVAANATSTANLTKVINIDSSIVSNANVSGAVTIVKFVQSSLNATATTTNVLDVVTQGIVSLEASLTASANLTGDIKRTATFVSSSTTSATTVLEATITKVLEASMSATATTQSAAQITIVINAAADATANISGDLSLSYSVNAALEASAQAIVNAQIARVIFAEMTATAQTTLEAAVGVTFVSSSVATATLIKADLFRSANIISDLAASANLTTATITTVNNVEAILNAASNLTSAKLTTVDNVAASVSGTATVTNATLNVAVVDPNFANVSLLLHGNGADGSTTFTDNSPNAFTVSGNGNAQIDTAIKQFGTGSLQFDGSGDFLTVPDNEAFTLGANNFTIEMWVYPNVVTTRQYLLYQGNSAGANISISFGIEITATSKIRALVFVGETGFFFVESISNITQSAWSHIAFVRDGTSINLYVNGTRVATTSISTNSINNSTNLVYIASGNTFLPYNGYIDDLRITKGVARYTGATLTVPTREFPDQ